ncbi:hypothetical protein ABKN59_007454 [Abortiporus biennis]
MSSRLKCYGNTFSLTVLETTTITSDGFSLRLFLSPQLPNNAPRFNKDSSNPIRSSVFLAKALQFSTTMASCPHFHLPSDRVSYFRVLIRMTSRSFVECFMQNRSIPISGIIDTPWLGAGILSFCLSIYRRHIILPDSP